uniref:Tryptophan synthase beta chain-like PALP domain-containing protein n=1 Tax=Auxenochlorella protothecoides TaxID=3075 RepID=A0A1D2ADP8_AUXPR
MVSLEAYTPPSWAAHLPNPPTQRLRLAVTPSLLHPWPLPGLPPGLELFIKRDDLTGMQLSGNKVRKLEFLLAKAKAEGHDSVITIGGIQSNHARATAVAARYCGLDSHLILRTSRLAADSDPGLVGNLLVERLVGAHIHTVTKEEYAAAGSRALTAQLERQLRGQGANPYVIPVGGSNGLGTWGYLSFVEELRGQAADLGLTDIVLACGSGSTAAGIALGSHLAGLGVRVHGYAVCDSEDYFYAFIDDLLDQVAPAEARGGAGARDLIRIAEAKGVGYGISTDEELATVLDAAQATGIILDPVYTCKALHGWLADVAADPAAWAQRRVLFVHTGGLLGMYDKAEQLQGPVQALQRAHRLHVQS